MVKISLQIRKYQSYYRKYISQPILRVPLIHSRKDNSAKSDLGNKLPYSFVDDIFNHSLHKQSKTKMF